MSHRGKAALFVLTASLRVGSPVFAQETDVRVVFLEPTGTADETYRVVNDTARVNTMRGWLANESARMALDLYARAWTLAPPHAERGEVPVYFIALVPGGNNAAVGLHVISDSSREDLARTPFIKLGPQDWRFSTTLLHETGHVVLAMLNDGRSIPKLAIAPISHTTAALTDRGTAFDEGFAISLETLAAHYTTDSFERDRYHHRRFRFGVNDMLGEFHRHAGDLLSFSQTIARYYEVRENDFAFAPSFRGPDYLRAALEKSRDFAALRDADQLLQSEGFYATFFFDMLVRGRTEATAGVVRERQQKVLVALRDMLRRGRRDPAEPFLLLFVESYIREFSAEADEIIDVLLDLSHGVFVDRDAAALWRAHYLGALRLDLAERDNVALDSARTRWHAEVASDVKVLYRNLGPQLRVEVPGRSVRLLAFGDSIPLSFDLNTVEEGVMRLVPGIADSEVQNWIRARGEKPFVDVADFRQRSGLAETTLAALLFGSGESRSILMGRPASSTIAPNPVSIAIRSRMP